MSATPATILPFPGHIPAGPLFAHPVPHTQGSDEPGPSLRDVHSEALDRLAEASRTGRATFTPDETALILEIAGASFRKGCQVG